MKEAPSGVLGRTPRCELQAVKRDYWWGYPFARNTSSGEQVKRSLVCTASVIHLLRPCWTTTLIGLVVGLLKSPPASFSRR